MIITNLDEVIFSVTLDSFTEGLDIFLEHIELITEEYRIAMTYIKCTLPNLRRVSQILST